jgi:FkbM family methyltransferase
MIKNLYDLGFKRSQICWPKIFNEIELGFFHNINFGSLPRNFSSCSPIDEKRNWLEMHKEKIEFVYEMLADEKSRAVFVDRIALSLNWDSISHYSDFIINHSEAVNKFGVYPIGQSEYSDGIENYFYFNNDIIAVKEGAIFVDAGAYTGDSVLQFYEAAVRLKVDYKKIIVFEPGEAVLKLLDERIATHGIPNVEVNKVGLWSSNGQLKYSEDVNGLPGSGTITECGNVEIPVTTLDSHLGNENITLLKIDTPGAVWDAVKGAQVTIKRCRPDLVLGIYHSPEAIFETPYLVHTIEPNYKLYIRHNQWFINETDLIATF